MPEAIYAVYAEGWSDPAGTQARDRGLAGEAIWLGRLAASLLPQEPEALGLLALMLHAEARREARRDREGEFVPLDTTRSSRKASRCSFARARWARPAATSSRRRSSRRTRRAA